MNLFKLSDQYKGALFIFLSAAGFSVKAILAKKLYLLHFDAISVLYLRIFFATPMFALLYFYKNYKQQEMTYIISKKEWLQILALGILGYYLSSLLDFIGLTLVTASYERMLLFCYPTFVVILTNLFFKSKFTRNDWIALFITYIGIIIVFYDEAFHGLKTNHEHLLLGSIFIIGSAITYACYLIGSGFIIPKVGASRYTIYTLLTSSLAIAIHFWISKGVIFPVAEGIDYIGLAILMALFSTFLPTILLAEGIQLIGSEKSSVISTIGPVSTIFLASMFLGEQVTSIQIIGTAIVIVGVLLISLNKKQKV